MLTAAKTPNTRRGGRIDRQPLELTIIVALVILAVAVGCGFGVVWAHANGERSSYTQSAGIAETATVTSVTTTGPKNPQTDISVLLGTPVGYQFVSDVYVPGDHSYDTGDKIKILTDPRDPSYSELPGQPDARVWPMTISIAILTLWFAVAGVILLVRAVRIWRARRQIRRYLPAT
jgi:hypothetical protein